MQDKNTSQPTLYPDLNAVLQELVESIQAVLGQDFIGAYLQGSFAVGDFDLHSDVDFVIVVEQELSGDPIQLLQAMHARIYDLDCAWAQHLEGSYFPRDILKSCARRGEQLWYLDNGSRSLVRSVHCNTLVVRWVLRQHGIALAGPDPASLIDPIPASALRQEMLEGLQAWGQQILADPGIINNRFYQTFAVLHYCRALHDLHTGTCGSKRAGAEWAKANLDPSWTDLIDRSWDGRPNPEISVRQPANPQDLARTLQLIRYIIEASTQINDTSI